MNKNCLLYDSGSVRKDLGHGCLNSKYKEAEGVDVKLTEMSIKLLR